MYRKWPLLFRMSESEERETYGQETNKETAVRIIKQNEDRCSSVYHNCIEVLLTSAHLEVSVSARASTHINMIKQQSETHMMIYSSKSERTVYNAQLMTGKEEVEHLNVKLASGNTVTAS